ncbi:hypothetical protein [Candidatus Portiera aleyrodidarum]|uniref:hypothetical protein n=1 Tax=Candidatus Portiera aleyrodidarum TaxID=91844 RepID=UPI000C792B92|nr:hypothetical protein [Candidatus Portiera aleyrodidarum]AUI72924.1 hypothetical protein BA952_00080 [Candidatus Portiera aleyrodidarum]AUI73173.1 hypothetical protein BBB03_00090 [Candidatus Portiera aleyrodidarum]
MNYKVIKPFNVHKTINQAYNFKAINKHFFCVGFFITNENSIIYKAFITKIINKANYRNILKRLFKEYIRIFNYNLIQVYLCFYISKYIFKTINYMLLTNLLTKVNNI